jgi:predicted ATPase
MPVRGLQAPVNVYEILGATRLRLRLHVAATRGLTHFVGRETELEYLYRALEQALQGHGQAVGVVGEAGVGKSRLFFEGLHAHRTQGWLVLASSAVSYGQATSYPPIIAVLREYFQLEERQTPQRIREQVTGKVLNLDERLRDAITPLLWLLDALSRDDPLWSLNAPHRQSLVLDALKRLFFLESQRQPLLLVVEDLHWLEAASQIVLDTLVDSLPTSRILLLTNYRPEYEGHWTSKTYYTRLHVDPLPPRRPTPCSMTCSARHPRWPP